MDKIKTGLPYSMEIMPSIIEHGAIVDMHDLHFPVPEDKQVHTSFIFLRNTGFNNVKLDFSNCSYEEREQFLAEYITSNIKIKNEELSDAWHDILCTLFFDNPLTLDNAYFTTEETVQFIRKYKDLIQELLQLLASLPVYGLFRCKLNKDAYTLDCFEKTDKEVIGPNYLNLLTYEEIPLIITLVDTKALPPLFYEKYFTEINNELFAAINENQLGISEAIYCLMTTPPKDLTKILSNE